MGKYVGNVVAGAPGALVGSVVGNELSPKGINLKMKSHRVGALQNRRVNRYTLGAALAGGLAGGAVGAVPGFVVGSMPGLIWGGLRARKAAQKMGYGKIGQAGAALTSLAGLTTPKSQKKDKDKDEDKK